MIDEQMSTIGIIGARKRNSDEDYQAVFNALVTVYELGDRLVSGGCPLGGDRFAERIAREYKIPITIHYADWSIGRHAGYARNGLIAADADVLIACVAPDRKGGTEDTIKKYLKLGKTRVILV